MTAVKDPGFAAAFASEWTKLITLRSARRNLVLGTMFGLAISIGLAFVVGETYDKWSPEEAAEYDPMLFPLTGGILAAIFYATVGVNAMAAEYSSGMIRLTLVATPKRSRVILAKALAVAVVTTVTGVVATFGMIGASQPIYSHYGLATVDFWSLDFLRLFIAGSLTTPLFPLLAMCVTVLVRSTATALTVVLVAMFVPPMIGSTLPKWWQERIVVLLPGPAADALSAGHLTDVDKYLHPAWAALIVMSWLVAMLAVAITVFARRDA